MEEQKPQEVTEYAVQCFHCEKWFKVVKDSSGICPHCNTDNDLRDQFPIGISRKDVKFLNYNWGTLTEASEKKEKNVP